VPLCHVIPEEFDYIVADGNMLWYGGRNVPSTVVLNRHKYLTMYTKTCEKKMEAKDRNVKKSWKGNYQHGRFLFPILT
jgi:hypothetical protein